MDTRRIQKCYDAAASYIMGDNSVSPHDIISSTCDEIADVPEFSELWDRCAAHINIWSAETFEEWVGEVDCIVEEISGTLAEWLDRN